MKCCPHCSTPPVKVIYMGAPMLLCQNEECSCVFGFWARLLDIVPCNGWFMTYDKGYVDALWCWLTGGAEEA